MIRRPPIFISALIFFVLAGTSIFIWIWHQNLSGTYVRHADNSVEMIRLVESQDGKLTGQFESVDLDSSGKITNWSGSVDGATDGKNISLKLNVSSLLPIPITVSGTHDGNSLTLTLGVSGKPSQTQVYPISDLTTFQSASDNITKKSQEIIAERTAAEARERAEAERQKFEGDATRLMVEMQNLGGRLDEKINKFSDIEHKYTDITAKVHTYYDKARNVSYSGNQYAVGQIQYAMNQGQYATDQLHYQVQSLNADFDTKAGPLVQTAISYEKSCKNIYSTNLPDLCQKFYDASHSFAEKVRAMSDGLKHLEQVYKTEYNRQRDLIIAVQHL